MKNYQAKIPKYYSAALANKNSKQLYEISDLEDDEHPLAVP